MKRSVSIFFVTVMSSAVMLAAAEKIEAPRLGVVMFPVSSQNPIDIENASYIRLLVSGNIAISEKLSVVDIGTMDRFMDSRKISAHNLYSPDEMKKIPPSFAQYLVTGFVSAEEKSYLVKIYLLDLAEKKFLFGEEARIDKKGNLLWEGVKSLTDRFLEKLEFAIPWYEHYTETEPVYSIGDRGPAGGIIFFVKSDSREGWRYLESAPPETEFRAAWGLEDNGAIIPASLNTASRVGSGYDNTEVFAAHSSLYGARNGLARFAGAAHSLAAMRCRALDSGGYNDWFLPSKDELMYMYTNLARRGLGGFSKDTYWSSTESAYEYAYAQSFREGRQFFNGYKTMPLSVRAVRAF